MTYVIQLLAAFAACIAFSVIYHAKRKRLFFCGFGGVVAWGIFLIASSFQTDIFVANIIAGAGTTIYAEFMARYTKTPAAVYLIPAILPLVPGGYLYYATSALITNENAKFKYNSRQTIIVALGISIGIIIITLMFYYFNQYWRSRRIAHEEQS